MISTFSSLLNLFLGSFPKAVSAQLEDKNELEYRSTQHMCHHALNLNVLCALRSQGKGPESRRTMRPIFPLVSYFSGHFSCDWRTTIHQNVVLTVFHWRCHICCVWNIFWSTFKCIVLLHLLWDCPRTYNNGM